MNGISHASTTAALLVLITLQTVMLFSLLAGVPPHPPVSTPLFGIGPFLGMSLSAALAAIILNSAGNGAGRVFSALAALLALVSFGPQKYFDAQFALIWPAVISGQVAAVVVLIKAVMAAKNAPDATAALTGLGASGGRRKEGRVM